MCYYKNLQPGLHDCSIISPDPEKLTPELTPDPTCPDSSMQLDILDGSTKKPLRHFKQEVVLQLAQYEPQLWEVKSVE